MKAKSLTSIGLLIAFITLIVGSIIATNSSIFLFFFFLFMAISIVLIVVGAFRDFFYLIDKK